MRRTKINYRLDEALPHPPELMAALDRLSAQAEAVVTREQAAFTEIPCPACGEHGSTEGFERRGFTYRRCARCSSLYVSPRPSKDLLFWYMQRSPFADFLKSAEYCVSVDEHRHAIALSRADRIATARHGVPAQPGAGILDLNPAGPYLAAALAAIGIGPVLAVRDPAEAVSNSASVVAGFELMERVWDIDELLAAAHRALVPGGRLILSMRSGSGFDILLLWDQARLLPLEHLNLLSVEGVQIALARHGFEVLELSTPGQLDVQMVERSYRDGIEGAAGRFLTYFFERRDRFARDSLQAFLQESLMSSHLMITAIRP